MKPAPLAVVLSLIFTAPVMAAEPFAALVEDITDGSAGVEVMDYVEPGQVIHLGPHNSIVLTYLSSCVHERIEGGIITVGREQSEVLFGKVERNSTPCDAGRMQLSAQIASQSAGMVLRSLRHDQSEASPLPQGR
jgi:hypothetical protein